MNDSTNFHPWRSVKNRGPTLVPSVLDLTTFGVFLHVRRRIKSSVEWSGLLDSNAKWSRITDFVFFAPNREFSRACWSYNPTMKSFTSFDQIRSSAMLSLLHILYECPYVDMNVAATLFSSYSSAANAISKLRKRGLIETFKGQDRYLPITTGYCLTEEGIQLVNSLQHIGATNRLSAADESFPDSRLYLTGIPLRHKGLQRGKYTHFHDLDITYLWLQLRWWKPQNFSLLWDNVKEPSILPMHGNPDLIFYDGINFVDKYFEDLMIVEYEASKKQDAQIFDRMEALAKNEPICIIIVSKEEDILKDYVNAVRKAVPVSNYYNCKRTLNNAVMMNSLYADRIWFLKWDPTKNSIRDNCLPQAIARRLDHPSFDLFTKVRYRSDGTKYLAQWEHDRWKRDNEYPMEVLIKAYR